MKLNPDSLKPRVRRFLLIILVVGISTTIFASRLQNQTTATDAAPPVSLQANVKLDEITATLEREVPKMMNEADLPGMAIALIRNGELAWLHGFGVKDANTKEAVNDNTVFEAASLSKPVFAYAVLKLVDAGKFDLDKPLNQYLPGNYDVGSDARLGQITARRVLSHTTGFPNWRGRDPQLKIYFTPGERFSYSGEGFVYLSKVIERVTNEKFNDFMKRMVFDPLEMTSSSYVWEKSYDTTMVTRHNSLGVPVEPNKPTEPNAAASLHTTARDYGRFVVAILKGTGLKEETVKLMLTPQIKVGISGTNTTNRPAESLSPNVSWGLGWGLQTTEDGLSFWHWGDNGECKAFVEAFDRQKIGVVMFANGATGLSFISELVSKAVGGQQPALALINYESYKSPARVLLKSIIAKGADPALHEYCEKRKGWSASERITESQLNRIGYDLLYGARRVKDAIEVFKLNVQDYPNSSNTYDSLGEAYRVDGNTELAIKNYERSVELDPKNTGGVDALKALRASKEQPRQP